MWVAVMVHLRWWKLVSLEDGGGGAGREREKWDGVGEAVKQKGLWPCGVVLIT